MINLCSATTIQHWFSKFYKLFETFREFRVFVFRYRATNENAELEENRIRVIFDWENLWEGIRIGPGIILRLFYQRRKEIMIFRGFRQFRVFRGIDLAKCKDICVSWGLPKTDLVTDIELNIESNTVKLKLEVRSF